jgi:hypothetical protein
MGSRLTGREQHPSQGGRGMREHLTSTSYVSMRAKEEEDDDLEEDDDDLDDDDDDFDDDDDDLEDDEEETDDE